MGCLSITTVKPRDAVGKSAEHLGRGIRFMCDGLLLPWLSFSHIMRSSLGCGADQAQAPPDRLVSHKLWDGTTFWPSPRTGPCHIDTPGQARGTCCHGPKRADLTSAIAETRKESFTHGQARGTLPFGLLAIRLRRGFGGPTADFTDEERDKGTARASQSNKAQSKKTTPRINLGAKYKMDPCLRRDDRKRRE